MLQQQSQDRETELIREISRLKQQLEKAQHQLDAWNAEVSASSHSMDFENMDIDDIKDRYLKVEASKKQLEAQIRLLKEEATASEFIKSKEIQLIRAQKDEELNKKLSKAKQEQRDEINVIKAENSMELQQAQQKFTEMLNAQVKKLTETLTDKDSKKMLE